MPLIWLRWLVLLVFVGGMTASITPLVATEPSIAWWSVAALLACALLLTQLGRDVNRTLWVWVILGVFLIGYYIQTYFVLHHLHDIVGILTDFSSEWGWVSPRIVGEAYGWITISFIVFCLSAFLWLAVVDRFDRSTERRLPAEVVGRRVLALLAVSSVASAFAMFLRWYLGVGVMGVAEDHLPYRLDTVVFRTQSHLLPGLFLLAMWITDGRRRRPALWMLSVTCFLAHSLAVAFLAASKAGVVWFALPVLFLWICAGRLTRARVGFMALALSTLLIAYPVMQALRMARIYASVSGQSADLVELTIEEIQNTNVLDTSGKVARQIVLRVSGAAGMWFTLRQLAGKDAERPVWRHRNTPLSLFYTQEVYGVSWPGDFRSPGIVAAFILLAGIWRFIGVWVFFIAAVGAVWWGLGFLRTAPMSRAYAAFHLELFVMEGTLQVQDLLTAGVVIIACELVYRVYLCRVDAVPVSPRAEFTAAALEAGAASR